MRELFIFTSGKSTIPRALMILFDRLFPKFEHSFFSYQCTKTQQPYMAQNGFTSH